MLLTVEGAATRLEGPLLFLRRTLDVGLADAVEVRGSDGRSRLGRIAAIDEQAQLERMARIIGKDALPARQQLTLLCAELVNEAFLRQSAFSEIDRVCGPGRQAAMMRLLGRFIDLSESALTAGAVPERITAIGCMRSLQRMGEEIADHELPRLVELEARMEREFAQIAPAAAASATPLATEPHDAAHG